MCSDQEQFITRLEDLYGSLNTYGKMENGEAVGGNPLSAQNSWKCKILSTKVNSMQSAKVTESTHFSQAVLLTIEAKLLQNSK